MGDIVYGTPFGKKSASGAFKATSDNPDFFTNDEKLSLARIFQRGENAGLFHDLQCFSLKRGFAYIFYGADRGREKTPLVFVSKTPDPDQKNTYLYKVHYMSANGEEQPAPPAKLHSFESVEKWLRKAVADNGMVPKTEDIIRARLEDPAAP